MSARNGLRNWDISRNTHIESQKREPTLFDVDSLLNGKLYLLLGGIGETNLSHQAVHLRHEGVVGVLDLRQAGFQQGVLFRELLILLLNCGNLALQGFVALFQSFVALIKHFNLWCYVKI